MPRTPSPLTELSLIDAICTSSARRNKHIYKGIGDDCAILRPPSGHDLLVTTDFTLENRHFRLDTHPPESVGHRCIARGISDIAAMGGRPFAAFLSLALPRTFPASTFGKDWIPRFFSGLHALADKHHVTLAGGDTAQSPDDLILADITLTGSVVYGRGLLRSRARAGDNLYVTGHLGGAAAELNSLLRNRPKSRKNSNLPTPHPHLFPEPRVSIGLALTTRHLASACIDLSDGLSSDLAHLCGESKLCAIIDESALPIHPLASSLPAEEALELALHGGEDYELLFAAPPSIKVPKRLAGINITHIGCLLGRRVGRPLLSLALPDGSRKPLKPKGWEHFSSSAK